VITGAILLQYAEAIVTAGAKLVIVPSRLGETSLCHIRTAGRLIDQLWVWTGNDASDVADADWNTPIQLLSEDVKTTDFPIMPDADLQKIGFLFDLPATPAERDMFTRLALLLEHVAPRSAIIVPRSTYYDMARAAPRGPILAAKSIEDVIASAGTCILFERSCDRDHLKALVLASGRRLILARSDDCEDVIAALHGAPSSIETASESPAHHHLATQLATLLQTEQLTDATQVGQRLARNLGIRVAVAFARFNPWLRLFYLEVELHGKVRRQDIGGRVILRGSGEMINALVHPLPQSDSAICRIRVTTVISDDANAGQIQVVVYLWGWPVASLAAPENIEVQRAGLIAFTPLGQNRAVVEYWGEAGDASIQLGKRLLQVAPARCLENGLAYFSVEDRYPFDRDTLTALSAHGVGQKFTNFRVLTNIQSHSSERLRRMRNQHQNEVAWLVGNGPSVRIEDLDNLCGRTVFGFNRLYLAYDRTKLRPTYTVSGDKQMLADFGEEIVARAGGQVFLADEKVPALTGDYCWVRQIGGFPSLFSRDPSLFVTPGGSSVYVALQLGFYMGIRKFFLYGTDFKFDFEIGSDTSDAWLIARGEGNHFIPDYRGGLMWYPPAIENILPSFLAARALIEAEGGFIRNATHGGSLDVFERIDFEQALQEG
jgi:hypothetical protein